MSRATGRFSTCLVAVFAAIGLSCPQTGSQPEPMTPPPELLVEVPSQGVAEEEPVVLTPVAEEEVDPVQEPTETVAEVPEPIPADLADDVDLPEAEPTVIKPQKDDFFELAALRKETWIFAEPRWSARRIGYLRSGTIIRRDERPAGFQGCKNGWYRIEPIGYVCVGRTASLETHHPMVEAAGHVPDRSEGLPYPYVMSEFPPPPQYVRLPSEAEQNEVEPDLSKHLSRKRDMSAFEALFESMPGSLLYNRSLPSPHPKPRAEDTLFTGRPVPRSGFGLLHVFSWTNRMFGITTDLSIIPLDRTRLIQASSMQGIHLVEDLGLPVAFVQSRVARLYRIDLETRVVQDAGEVQYREGFSLTGQRVKVGEHVYLETRHGTYLRENNRVVVIPTLKNVPSWATPGRKWIDVSILRQTLVAYEGTRPVFATMVSAGADGLGDPEETRSTVLGAFLIHTKHVTSKMSSNEEGDVYDLHDVPYVQYFHGGYALHGAYWHDGFGTPRSHGCINVSPADAAWLFGWTDPEVPPGWHGRLQLRGGTLIHTHP